jgi:hypothetical protein
MYIQSNNKHMTNTQWNWKKWLNGVIVIPEDTTDLIKYGTALVVALLAKYGYGELGEFELMIIAGIVKAVVDRVHYWWKYE